MLCEVPLTKEQQEFAAEHHGLVYKFLNDNHLSEDEFYDVVIFPYLTAVRDYCNSSSAQKYSFSTIAMRQTKCRNPQHPPWPVSRRHSFGKYTGGAGQTDAGIRDGPAAP